MLENEQEIIPENEQQVDELLNDINAPSEGMHDSAEETAAPVEQQSAQPTQQQLEEFALTVGGKEIKATKDKLIKWAQMGYDAPQRIGELSKKLETYTQQEKQWKEIEAKYGEIDKFVREKPEFWDLVQKQWNQREQLFNDPANPLATTVQTLQQQVQGLLGKVTTYEQQQAQKVAAREDQELDKEIEGVKTKYSQIDFSTPDESGKSLEWKVLEFAAENGIKKFDTAFKAFYHDELVKLHSEQAKESVVKNKQQQTKQGIIGKTPHPTKQMSDDVKGKSYNDLVQETLKEFGLT